VIQKNQEILENGFKALHLLNTSKIFLCQTDYQVTWEQIQTVIHCTVSHAGRRLDNFSKTKENLRDYWCHNLD